MWDTKRIGGFYWLKDYGWYQGHRGYHRVGKKWNYHGLRNLSKSKALVEVGRGEKELLENHPGTLPTRTIAVGMYSRISTSLKHARRR